MNPPRDHHEVLLYVPPPQEVGKVATREQAFPVVPLSLWKALLWKAPHRAYYSNPVLRLLVSGLHWVSDPGAETAAAIASAETGGWRTGHMASYEKAGTPLNFVAAPSEDA